MSVSQETLEMIRAAVKNGANPQGTFVRSKLTNRLVWQATEHDENDPYKEYLQMVGVAFKPAETSSPVDRGRSVLGEMHVNGQSNKGNFEDKCFEKKGNRNRDKENWQDHWEILKKAGKYCSFCKANQEICDIYLSHNLKGPNGEVTCPILRKCLCQCCGQRGHTIAYCPGNRTGTSILKMINHHNRI
ncbi:nanos homolog 2-like [Malaya genurostris]|uniref:nanos homolog 2-like n=1 Tax=Malaya genurostris TaxID=325434 RepID=UPI0026F3AEB9|nr:nanos homolog 2-like [Malaya genurostris]